MRVFDYSLLKEKTWDSEIISLVAQIHEYKGRQEVSFCKIYAKNYSCCIQRF